MVLEDALDLGANFNRLHRVAQQIANHANATSLWQLDEHGKVRAVLLQGGVRRMPDALPAKDAAARLDLRPFDIEGVAMMAYPFGAELPGATARAALHQKAVLAQARPIRRGQAVGLGRWDR